LFTLNLKVWDNFKHEYLIWRKVKTASSSMQVFINDAGTNRQGWVTIVEHPKRYTLCFSLGQTDKNGVILYSGDLVKSQDGKIGEVQYSQARAGFFVKYDGALRFMQTDKIEKIGDIFNTSNKVMEANNAKRT
jgi:hypothetical protein